MKMNKMRRKEEEQIRIMRSFASMIEERRGISKETKMAIESTIVLNEGVATIEELQNIVAEIDEAVEFGGCIQGSCLYHFIDCSLFDSSVQIHLSEACRIETFRKSRLSDLLIKISYITVEELAHAADYQYEHPDCPIMSEILFPDDLLDLDDLDEEFLFRLTERGLERIEND
ncbi:MAG: hypothetical protein ACXQS8_06940 [Candidatus Helarchaeales archaeon]